MFSKMTVDGCMYIHKCAGIYFLVQKYKWNIRDVRDTIGSEIEFMSGTI